MNKIDFRISEDGELEYDNTIGDSQYVMKDDLVKQICINRIKSITDDWFNTNIGANLEQFLGHKSNTETHNKIVNAIINSLTHDNFLSKDDIFIIPKADKYKIENIIFIKSQHGGKRFQIELTLDLVGEIKINYGANS